MAVQRDHDASVLMLEYQRVYTEIMDMQRKSETLFGIGVTVLGATVIYGLKGEISSIFAIAAIASSFLLLYLTMCYSVIMSLGGYKRYLEDELNQQTSHRWLVWESEIAKPMLHDPWQMKALWAFLIVIPVSMFTMSLAVYDFPDSTRGQLVFSVVCFALLFGCAVSAMRLRYVSDLAYGMAKNRAKDGER